MSEKSFKIVGNDISDGYHTFDELYEHRCLLFLVLCLSVPERCVWRQDYDTWFCLYMKTPVGQISYHIPNKYLSLIDDQISRDNDIVFDGHTSQDVVSRLKLIAEGVDQ